MKLRIAATGQDAAMIARMADSIWRAHYPPIIGDAQVDYMLATFQSADAIRSDITRGRHYRIIEDEHSAAVGYLGYDIHADHLFLSKLYILPTSQRRGHGKQALARIVELHPALDIRLTVNKHNHTAITFYECNGFIKEGPVVADIGNGYVMDDWKMVRTADSST